MFKSTYKTFPVPSSRLVLKRRLQRMRRLFDGHFQFGRFVHQ